MLAHLGLSWFYLPYSQYIGVFLPIFFFVSGAVAYNSASRNLDKKHTFLLRYITLIVPFLLFTWPYLFNEKYLTEFNLYELVTLLTAWPDRAIYSFPIKQIWFINALIMMFFMTHHIFRAGIKNRIWIIFPFIASVVYLFIAEGSDLPKFYRDFYIVRKLDYPNQLHQVLSLFNYYLFGAVYYSFQKVFKKLNSVLTVIFGFICAMLIFNVETPENMRSYFFERNLYFTSFSYFVLFFVMGIQPYVKSFIYQPVTYKLFKKLSDNSYALFLLHTALLFAVEKLFHLESLSNSPLLAVARIIIVISLSLMLAPFFTRLSHFVLSNTKSLITERNL